VSARPYSEKPPEGSVEAEGSAKKRTQELLKKSKKSNKGAAAL
jgi:hypothetical protein